MITVKGPVLLSDGRPFIGRLRLTPIWAPLNLASEAVLNNALTVNAEAPDGLWDDYNDGQGLQLAPGAWLATFLSAPGAADIPILVPAGEPGTEILFMDLASTAGTLSTPTRLIEIVAAEGFQLTQIHYDADNVPTTATVLWPDGSGGLFTTTLKNANFLTIDAFTITHAISGKTVTQAAVTRDALGNVTTAQPLTVT